MSVMQHNIAFDTGSSTRDVFVAVQPGIVNPPLSQRVVQGTAVTFQCGAEGKPKPIISWYFNSDTMPIR